MTSHPDKLLSKEALIELKLFEVHRREITRHKQAFKRLLRDPKGPTDIKALIQDQKSQLGLNFNQLIQLMARTQVLQEILGYELNVEALAHCAGLSLKQYLERTNSPHLHNLNYLEQNDVVSPDDLHLPGLKGIAKQYRLDKKLKLQPQVDLDQLSLEYQELVSKDDSTVRHTSRSAFLVNTLRHRYSTWDHLLRKHGITADSEDYSALKTTVLIKIAKYYPDLIGECTRQMENVYRNIKKQTMSRVMVNEMSR